jgi:hypothetical protein
MSPFPLASASTTFRLVILSTPDAQGGKIGLLVFGNPAPAITVPARPKVGIGDMVFVIRLDDIPALCAGLKADGVPSSRPNPPPTT